MLLTDDFVRNGAVRVRVENLLVDHLHDAVRLQVEVEGAFALDGLGFDDEADSVGFFYLVSGRLLGIRGQPKFVEGGERYLGRVGKLTGVVSSYAIEEFS